MRVGIFWLNLLSICVAAGAFVPTPALAKEKAKPLIIVTTDWPPFEYEHEKKAAGSDVAVVEEAFRRMDIPVTVSVQPWARCLKSVQTGKADGIFTLRKTADREAFLEFPKEPISVSENVFFRRVDAGFSYRSEVDLKGRNIGAVIGYDYGNDFATSREFKRDILRNDEMGFDKLAAGRMDYMICDKAVGRFVLRKNASRKKLTFDPVAYSKFDMYLAFGKKKELAGVAEKFSAAIQEMKRDGSYDKIVEAAMVAAEAR